MQLFDETYICTIGILILIKHANLLSFNQISQWKPGKYRNHTITQKLQYNSLSFWINIIIHSQYYPLRKILKLELGHNIILEFQLFTSPELVRRYMVSMATQMSAQTFTEFQVCFNFLQEISKQEMSGTEKRGPHLILKERRLFQLMHQWNKI